MDFSFEKRFVRSCVCPEYRDMPRIRRRNACQKVSERVVVCLECGLSFRDIDHHVGRNPTTVINHPLKISERLARHPSPANTMMKFGIDLEQHGISSQFLSSKPSSTPCTIG
ncbi:hypothetical protein TNCV_2251161 [Trichonephila clavipes]|nr:hypothetical protein TNCV_2251161 [Trichonephila clavipes]